jgi:protein SCO1/2
LIDKKRYSLQKDDLNPIFYYDGLDKKGVRDIQQDINVLLEENKYR